MYKMSSICGIKLLYLYYKFKINNQVFLKLKYLFLSLIISIVINSCRKKECWETGECTPIHYDFNLDSIKDYFHAEKGSYWIYLNTKTNELDTHICTGYLLDTIHH